MVQPFLVSLKYPIRQCLDYTLNKEDQFMFSWSRKFVNNAIILTSRNRRTPIGYTYSLKKRKCSWMSNQKKI